MEVLFIAFAWLTFWILLTVFELTINKAALVTGLIFLFVALVVERPWLRLK